MFLGIDLGTSNSAIAGNLNSELRIFKTEDGTDVLPSFIYIDRRGHKFVGVRAYEQAFRSPDNVAQGFKRLMGTDTPLHFAASGDSMMPEEASAEIIRTLYGQAVTESGVPDILGTVVTIPAAFNQMQCEATIRSAIAAGLNKVTLLQEPIAASMAAISELTNKNGQFLVYDMGGGTFDLALVQSLSGSVNIIAHEGINMLGGRDFDRTILNSVVRPWLMEQFDLSDEFQKEERHQRLMRLAQWVAERAKIELSTKNDAVIFAGDEDVRAKDDSGNDMFIEVELSRDQLEALVSDRIDETIVLSRKILKDNGYRYEDIDKVVFIGGPSKMPSIRSRVPQKLGIPADLQTDPMTAVALGAAIFAESREWSESTTTRKTSRASQTTTGPIEIRYDFPSRTSDDRARVKVRPSAQVDGNGYELQIDSQEGWTSGRVEIVSDLTVQIPLAAPGDNAFRITVFDPNGGPVAEACSNITVMRTHAAAAGIPATHTISVKVVEGIGDIARNVLDPMVEKGTLLPAHGRKSFRAARDVRAGEPDHIDLELYQQAPGVPEPELNLFVGSFRINSDVIPPSMAIRKGDEVVVNWTMDDNGLLNATIEIPSVSQIFDTGHFYADTAGHRNFEGNDGDQLAQAVLSDAEHDLEKAEEVLGSSVSVDITELKRRLERQEQELREAHDADTRRSVTEEARHIRQSISRLKHAPENRARVLTQRLDELVAEYDRSVRAEADPRSNERVDQLIATTRAAIQRGNMQEAERATSEFENIFFRELYQQPAYLMNVFKMMSEERYLATDKTLFDRLVEQGMTAIAVNDIDGLRRVIGQLLENRFNVGSANESLALLAGLMRA